MMEEKHKENSKDSFEEALLQFVESELRGVQPDLNKLIAQYPNHEEQIRQKIQSFKCVNSMFDVLGHAQEMEFENKDTKSILQGQKIGSFEIEKVIGQGGMGVVYLAHDTKLGRSVAIKCMPEELVDNINARTRFLREAKILASLNHPNIAVIYDMIEQPEDSGLLVMEYVPGRTIAEHIMHKPLKLEEALSIGRQVAEALAAAYDQGIIHRDIKPGNIKITPEGRVKVLDFGLAKASISHKENSDISITQPGRIIGTPAYMSPEQARGSQTDHRTDIWSFGCLMYEMLTGQLPFEGDTATDIVARILEREPDWQPLPPEIPPNIKVLLRRCLHKDPRRRLQHIGDAVIEISETPTDFENAGTNAAAIPGVPQPVGLRLITAVIVIVFFVVVTVGVVRWNKKRQSSMPVSRFPISLPQKQMLGEELSMIAVSPDGKRLVYASSGELFLRELDQVEGRVLSETKGAIFPFFSADGQSIGFGAGGKLKTLSLNGGRPKNLCDASNLVGGNWAPDGVIYFSPAVTTGIWKISADGGNPEQVTTPDKNKGEFSHWWPEVLPGGEAIIFTTWKTTINDTCVDVLSLKTGERRTLLVGGSHASYAPTGHLLYAQSGTLMAVPFDLKQFKVGEPRRPVVEGLKQHLLSGYAPFCFSQDGLLYYVRGGEWLARRQLVWVNRQGEEVETVPLPPRAYKHPRISPDGLRLAFSKFEGGTFNIWLYDLPSGPATQLTFESNNYLPLWTPDSKHLTFTSWRAGPFDAYQVPVDRSSTEQPLLIGAYDQIASSWSPNGKVLLFTEANPDTSKDIWFLSIEDVNIPQSLLNESWDEQNAVFSPDGNWIAYQSNQEGRSEIYVTTYPVSGGQKVSISGGHHPVWSGDGKELFYHNGDKMISVSIETKPQFRVTGHEVLFGGRYSTDLRRNYDVSGDGQRFLRIRESEEQQATTQLIVVMNWFEELERLVPTGKGK